LFLHFLPYFVSSSAKFNYKLVVILLEMLMKAKNIDEHIKKIHMPLEQKEGN